MSNIWSILEDVSSEFSRDRTNRNTPATAPTISVAQSNELSKSWSDDPWLKGSLSVDEISGSSKRSQRSMSIFESFDDYCQSPVSRAAFRSNNKSSLNTSATSPSTASTVSDNRSSIQSLSSDDGCAKSNATSDRMNAEVSALIKDHGRKGDLSSCWNVWNSLIQDHTPNEITLGCMVDALVSNHDVRHAEALVNHWKQRGCVMPNTVVYSTLIHGWAKQNDARRAMGIFEQMKKEQVPCNAVTYNCMIHACVRAGDMQCALELLYAMKNDEDGLCPDKFTYSTIIKGYCGLHGEIESALFLFESMLAEGLTPDLVIYNTLLDGCVKTRYNDVCDKLLNDMVKEWNINPNSYTLSILIKRFGRQGDLDKAFQLVELFPRKYGFRANAHVWTCLISACVSHGRFSLAESVCAAMVGNQRTAREFVESNTVGISDTRLVISTLSLAALCPPDAKTFETLAQGYVRYNNHRRAAEVLAEGLERLSGNRSLFNQQLLKQLQV